MRDMEVIDSELRLLAAVRRVAVDHGVVPSSTHVDALLDERLSVAAWWRDLVASRPKSRVGEF
jgi:hypothetical protein